MHQYHEDHLTHDHQANASFNLPAAPGDPDAVGARVRGESLLLSPRTPGLNLHDAASAPDILTAALRYRAQGLTVLPVLKGEKDSGLKGWQNLQLSADELRRLYRTGKYGGVALRPGARSQNLVMLDCDGEAVYTAFCALFPALVDTYTERSGSGKGYHLFYQVDRLPSADQTPGIGTKIDRKGIFDTDDLGFEMFFERGAVVVAPSIHPSGNPYTVEKPLDVLRVANLDDVVTWALALEDKNARKRRARSQRADRYTHTPTGNSDLPADLIRDIEQALGVKGYKHDGWSNPIRCVLKNHQHDDTNPAAAWNGEKHIYSCLKCGITDMLALDTARALNLDVQRYYDDLRPVDIVIKGSARPTGSTPRVDYEYAQNPGELPRYHPSGTPDEWRAALLALDGAAAVTYEVINDGSASGSIDPAQVGVADVMREALIQGKRYSESLYRRGFRYLKDELFRDLHTEITPNSVCKIEKNPQGGRRADVITLPPLGEQKRRIAELRAPSLYERAFPAVDKPERPAVVADLTARAIEAVDLDDAAQIADEINAMSAPAYEKQAQERRKANRRAKRLYNHLMSALDDATHTPLPDGWNPHDVQSYRAALLRARMDADPDRLRSRRQIADALGISARSVDTYLQLAGIETESDQYEQHPITSAADVEREVTRLAYEAQGKPLQIIACAANGDSIEVPYNRETARDFVPRQLAAGAQVSVKIQVANRHTVDQTAEPPAATSRRQPEPMPEPIDAPPAPAQPTADPMPERRRQVGYHRQWVRDQLVLRLRLMGWQHNGRLINPDTGEIAALDADARGLISFMLGREVGRTAEPVDSLIELALTEGAVIKVLA